MKIGNLDLPGNLVLSPMAGVTDAPFRYIARKCGAHYTVSEMISAKQELWDTNKTQLRVNDNWQTFPKIIQIAGASPEVVSEAAIKCEDFGADIVEINMGCPAKKVCNVLSGSALLKDEDLVYRILSEVGSKVSIPVTLKTRLGWDHDYYNIEKVALMAQDCGIKSLTIHGRTRSDLYNGEASYDLIAKVKQNVAIPVFANGDITSIDKAISVLDLTKADGLYIGRGVLGRPWIFNQINHYIKSRELLPDPSINEIKAIMLEHLDCIYQHYGDEMGCKMSRKHVKWYLQNLDALDNHKQRIAEFNQIESAKLQIKFIQKI